MRPDGGAPIPDLHTAGRSGAAVEVVGHRYWPLDALRGLCMVVMAFGHVPYFFERRYLSEFWGVPLPSYDNGIDFIARLVTHPVAPGFFLLMGAGLYLFAQSRRRQGWSESRIARYLVLRGGFLVLLQFCAENPAWLLGARSELGGLMQAPGTGGTIYIYFGVLYALGGSMIIWGLAMRIGPVLILVAAILAILCTQWMVPGPAQANRAFPTVSRLLAVAGQDGWLHVRYPLLPWLGVTGLGVVLGATMAREAKLAYRAALAVGCVLLVAFVALRASGSFGSFHPYAGGDWISFLNVTKYPPSIVFLCLSLGVVCLMLWCLGMLEPIGQRHFAWLADYGRAPLFFYIVHLYAYGVTGLIVTRLGLGSAVLAYGVWLVSLYPLLHGCRWYFRYRRRRGTRSVWRYL